MLLGLSGFSFSFEIFAWIKDNSKIQSVAILDVDQIEKEFEEEYSKTQELILQNNQDNIETDSSEDERD